MSSVIRKGNATHVLQCSYWIKQDTMTCVQYATLKIQGHLGFWDIRENFK